MDSCHILRPYARRSFTITPYRAGGDGQLEPAMPEQCIAGAAGHGGQCVVRVHHRRPRKTGPEYPLVVAECLTHAVAFTLYPPGFVPYGREAIVPVDAEGELVRHSEADEDGPQRKQADERGREQEHAAQKGGPSDPDLKLKPENEVQDAQLAWELTLFGAAQDGARGDAWPRAGAKVGAGGSWRTQGRRIVRGAEVLGLVGETPELMRTLVGPLAISALTHQDASAAYGEAAGYQSRARAVVGAITELETAGCQLLDRILEAGCAAGLWGRAWRWNAGGKRLCEVVQVVPKARSP